MTRNEALTIAGISSLGAIAAYKYNLIPQNVALYGAIAISGLAFISAFVDSTNTLASYGLIAANVGILGYSSYLLFIL